jgi:hypothetical protein
MTEEEDAIEPSFVDNHDANPGGLKNTSPIRLFPCGSGKRQKSPPTTSVLGWGLP